MQRIEHFTEYRDAAMWLETALDDLPDSWVIFNAGINYINNRWRVGFSAGPAQMDMFIAGT